MTNYTGIYFPVKNGVRTSWSELPLRKDSTPDRRYAINKRYKGVSFKIVNGEFVRPSKRKLVVKKENANTSEKIFALLSFVLILVALGVVAL